MEQTLTRKETVTVYSKSFKNFKEADAYAYNQATENNQSYYIVETKDPDDNIYYDVVDDQNYAKLKLNFFFYGNLSAVLCYSR